MNEIPDKKADLFEFADQNAKRIVNRFTAIKKKYGIEDRTVLEEFVN
jgi:hypothetical protein